MKRFLVLLLSAVLTVGVFGTVSTYALGINEIALTKVPDRFEAAKSTVNSISVADASVIQAAANDTVAAVEASIKAKEAEVPADSYAAGAKEAWLAAKNVELSELKERVATFTADPVGSLKEYEANVTSSMEALDVAKANRKPSEFSTMQAYAKAGQDALKAIDTYEWAVSIVKTAAQATPTVSQDALVVITPGAAPIPATSAILSPTADALLNGIIALNELAKDFPSLKPVFDLVSDAIAECMAILPVETVEESTSTVPAGVSSAEAVAPATPAVPVIPAPQVDDPMVNEYVAEANFWVEQTNQFLE